MISLRLIDPIGVINRRVNKAISQELNNRMSGNIGKARRRLKNIIPSWIMSQPEISSLLSQGVPNTLNAEFGLPPGLADEAVNSIVSAVVRSIEVHFKKFSPVLKGGVVFNFQSSTFSNLLGLVDGHVVADLGGDLHWLDWLLTKGDTTIIKGYYYKPSGKGRSGGGTMDIGGSFRVDPSFSGTTENNFITRAFRDRDDQLEDILSDLLR
jgi:hypothetical protein